MDADKPNSSIDLTQHKLDKARALWAVEEADRFADKKVPSPANLDREPGPPHAPEASPVEARVRRFAGARDWAL